jgi:hypothetical protein
MKFFGWLYVFILFFQLPGCHSIFREDPGSDRVDRDLRAQALLAAIKTRNDTFDAVKGIGRITLREADVVRTTRAAWLGAKDGRLRIEILGPAGQPAAKLIFDGKTYAFISHVDQQVYQQPGTVMNLKTLTGVSVMSEDVVRYFAGAVPLRDHDGVRLTTEDNTGREVLILNDWWRGTVQKIYPDMGGEVVSRVEMFWWGRLIHRAELGRFRKIGGRWIPFHIHVTDGADNGFAIDVDNCWTGFPLTPDMFSVTPVRAEDK